MLHYNGVSQGFFSFDSCASVSFLWQGLDNLTPKEQEEVHMVCDIIPDVEVQVDIFVEDEGEIAENDLVTIKVPPLPKSQLGHDCFSLSILG